MCWVHSSQQPHLVTLPAQLLRHLCCGAVSSIPLQGTTTPFEPCEGLVALTIGTTPSNRHALVCPVCLPSSFGLVSSHKQVTGTKAELMLRILGAFNLSSPTAAPAELLRALVLERSPAGSMSLHWGGPGSRAWNNKILDARGGIYHANPAAGTAVGKVRCRQRHPRRAQGMRVSLACLLRCGIASAAADVSSNRCGFRRFASSGETPADSSSILIKVSTGLACLIGSDSSSIIHLDTHLLSTCQRQRGRSRDLCRSGLFINTSTYQSAGWTMNL